MSGRPICSRMVSLSWIPREVPGTRAITPLRASARKCSSAALADLKPSSRAISARVGGMPVSEINRWTRRRICVWRGVRSDMSAYLFIYTVTVIISRSMLRGKRSCCLGSLPRRNSATRDSSKVNQPAAPAGRMYAYSNAAALPGVHRGQETPVQRSRAVPTSVMRSTPMPCVLPPPVVPNGN